MPRRHAALALAITALLAACGGATPSAPAPATSDPGSSPSSERTPLIRQPPAVEGAQVTITTETGTAWTFDVVSCTSPGTNVINLQATGPDGDLDLRASAQGGFRINTATEVVAVVDVVEIAEDGSVTASGTLALGDAEDVRVPFELVATPGSCA